MWFQNMIETLFGLALFANAILFIPQAIKLLKKKDSSEVSLATFAGFNVIQLLIIFHGILKHDLILVIGYALGFITCAVVTFLILYYRKRKSGHCEE